MAIVRVTDLAGFASHVLVQLERGESTTIAQDGTVLGTITPVQRSITVREALERIERVPRAVGAGYKADIRNLNGREAACDSERR